ncbi:MAG: class I SAM-dependent methyltransferase [Nocardioides sp.]
MSDELKRHARSFGGVADAYDRGRPSYPDDAVTWLTGPEPLTVLELGAGTGKLTERLVALGHDVHASEPDLAMLEILRRNLPEVPTSATSAEEIPLGDQSVDVVVGAQCFHWFDPETALPEIARVLKPGGHLSLVWHQRDERIPWVKKLGRIIGNQDQLRDPTAPVDASGLFGEVEAETFKFWQVVDRRSIVDLARSRSNLAVMEDAERERVLADLLALYDDYGRGMDGMQLPYRTACFRTPVLAQVVRESDPVMPLIYSTNPDEGRDLFVDSAATLPRVTMNLPDDASTMLIDFR